MVLKELEQYRARTRQRDHRHPNWRQVYLDCNGMCQFPVREGVVCGEVDGLEYHEIYREVKENELRPQQRVLLCNYHHRSVHGEKWVNERHYPSMLQFDISFEISLCGGLQAWIARFGLIEREVNYDKAFNSGEHQGYFNCREDS